jgi:hypothetical protein
MSSRSTALTRRTLLGAIGLTPLTGCMVTGNPPLPHARIRAIRVDVGPLAARGVSNWAARIRTLAEAAVHDAFADALAPGDRSAPDLTLVVDQAWLTSYSGGSSLTTDPDASTDWMDGWITTSPAHGLPELRHRVMIRVDAADSGPWYAPDIDARRLEHLTRAWVAGARRELAQ